MTVYCYVTPKKVKGLRMATHFARGCGGCVLPEGHPRLEDGPAFFYGWTDYTVPLIEQCKRDGRDWWYGDNAYYLGRGDYFRLTHNGLMVTGHGAASQYGIKRLKRLGVHLNNWRQPRHGKIVIATQSEAFYSERLHMPRAQWSESLAAIIREHTKRQVIVCDKPEAKDMHQHQAHSKSLELLLQDAWCLVTHSSSAAVAAIVAGVPVFNTAPSMASAVALDDLSRIDWPFYPENAERERWLAVLAANQWSMGEIERGEAWQRLQATRPKVAA